MANDNGFTKYTVDGVRYSAYNVQGNVWMVKRYIDDNDAHYVECLFNVDAHDDLTAIRAAIANNSWA